MPLIASPITLNGPEYTASPIDGKVRANDKPGTKFSIAGVGFGTHGLDIEFLGGADGPIRTADIGVAPSPPNWSVTTAFYPAIDAYVVNDATRGKSWNVDFRGIDGTLGGEMRYDYGSTIPENTDVYVGWWVYLNEAGPLGQFKILRVKADQGLSDTGGEIVLSRWQGGAGHYVVVRPDDALSVGVNDITAYNAEHPTNDGTWCFMELLLRSSTQGVADGVVKQGRLVEGSVYEKADLSIDLDENAVMTIGENLRWRWFMFQNYVGNGYSKDDDPIEVGISDPYIQVGTHKRVFLTNHATFSSSTWMELQNPSVWIDSDISFGATPTFNLANRGSGTYWLHVVDGINTVLATQQVTV